MKKSLRLIFLTCFLLAAPLKGAAQHTDGRPSLSSSMGSTTIGQDQFYRISMRPDIPIGSWGVALDIELFIDSDGDVSARGWQFGSSTKALDSFLRKIYYVSYGSSEDSVRIKIGALEDIQLGYGLIMSDYRNTLQYPGTKKTGIQFNLRDIAGTSIGLEGVINNIQDIKEGGALIGLRTSVRPMKKLEVGLTYVVDLDQYSGLLDGDGDGFPDVVDAFPSNSNLALDNDNDGIPDQVDSDDDNDGIIDIDEESGYNADVANRLRALNADYGDGFPVDTDIKRKKPFNKSAVGRDRFAIAGLDVAYTLRNAEHARLKAYAQLALLIDDDDELSAFASADQGLFPGDRRATGWGIAAPGLWLNTGMLDGQIEFRHFRNDFSARYFDALYELDRARIDLSSGRAHSKDALLTNSEPRSGVFGRLGVNLGTYMHASVAYQYLSSNDNPQQQLLANAHLSSALLSFIPRLTHARAYFKKNNIGMRLSDDGTQSDGFFEATEDTFYGYELGLEMNGGVSIFCDVRYLFNREADDQIRRKKIMLIETVFNF